MMKMQNVSKMRITKPVLTAALVLAGVTAITAGRADASLTVTLSETGYVPVTFTDTTNSGAVSYFGAYGGFTTNFIVGESNRLSGTGSVGNLQIESLNVTSVGNSGTQTLVVTLTDSGYTAPGTTGSTEALDSSAGGTFTSPIAGDNVTFQSEVLTPFTTTPLQSFVAPVTTAGTTSFSSVTPTVNFVRPSTYGLENITTISLSGAGETANVSGTTTVTAPVPEPAMASIAAVTGIALLRRRRAAH